MTLLLQPRPDVRIGRQEPRVASHPGTAVTNAASEVADLCAGASFPLDPWQIGSLELILGERPDGKWACREAGYLVSRQNGKGGILHALDLAGLYLFDDVREIIHTAHEHKTARKAYRELREIIKSTPHLYAQVERRGARVVGFRQSNEDCSITLQDESVVRFVARSNNSVRGFSPQMVIMDEAQECTFDTRAALKHTIRAQPNPLVIWCGTVPTPKNNGEVFTMLRDRGRAGGDRSLGWIEFTAPPDCDLASDEAIEWTNPGMGFRLTWDSIDLDREAALLNDEEWENFCREALSHWPDDSESARWEIVSRAQWAECASTETGKRAEKPGWFTGPVALGIEVDQDRAGATIGVAGDCREGGVGMQVGSVGPVAQVVPEVLRRLADTERPISHVVIDPGSPAGALIGDLEAAGVTVTPCKYADLVKATGDLYDAIVECDVVYRDPGGELTAAVAAAVKRRAGDAWLIDRRAGADVSAFGAVNLARWGHLQPVEPEPYALAVYA